MLLVQVLSKYTAVRVWRSPLTDKGSEAVQPELDLRSGRTGSIRHSGSCVSLSLIQLTVIVSQLVLKTYVTEFHSVYFRRTNKSRIIIEFLNYVAMSDRQTCQTAPTEQLSCMNSILASHSFLSHTSECCDPGLGRDRD